MIGNGVPPEKFKCAVVACACDTPVSSDTALLSLGVGGVALYDARLQQRIECITVITGVSHMIGLGSRAAEGIRWQVWASMLGGLGVLAVIAYTMNRKPAPPPERDETPAPVRKRLSDSNDDGMGFSSSPRRSRLRNVKKAFKPNTLRAAPRRRVVDAGAPDVEPPEQSAKEKKPKGKKMGWLRGKVVSLPGSKMLTQFVVLYAKVNTGFFFQRQTQKGKLPSFPKDAVVKTVKVSEPKGHFDIKTLAGSYLVQIKAKGFRPSTISPSRAGTVSWFRRTFGLLKEGRGIIRGEVVGRKGKPVSGAMAAALITGGSRWGWRMLSMGGRAPSAARVRLTNKEGEFVINRLPAGAYGVVVRVPGYLPWKKQGIQLADGERFDLGVIKLDGQTGTIKGTVYGPDGKGKSGVNVVSIGMGKKGRNIRFTRSDSSGLYTLKDVPAGKVRVFARMGRGFMSPSRVAQMTVKAGETHTHDFRFGLGGITLRGKVYDTDGSPLQNAKVSAMARITKNGTGSISSGEATTDKEGSYSISGLEEGRHSVTVTLNKKPSPGGSVDVKGRETDYDIRLQGAELSISVIDKLTKKPLKIPVFAILTWSNPDKQRVMQSVKPGESTVFKNLPAVPLELRIFTPGYSAYVKSNVDAGGPGKRTTLAVPLEPAGKVLLTLKTRDKKELERVFVRLSIDGKYQWMPSQMTAGGDLLVSTLPPGSAQLKITAKGYEDLEVTVNVPTKETGKATFFLSPAAASPTPARPTPR
ncbi:MAG: carboxypeptidase regulatory-like domain-containing protein [Deltaproteobacteria bacterium]|nr:MAG: carboxypeptidase regulatory-like domain-containing protein [Deltaproteobacteria bacterium]